MTDSLHGMIQEPRWCRGAARIDGDHVVLEKDAAHTYGVESADYWEELPFRLSRLIRTDTKGRESLDKHRLRMFVRDYGMLKRGPEHLNSGALTELLDDWRKATLKLRRLIDLYRARCAAVLDVQQVQDLDRVDVKPVMWALRALRDVDGSRESIPDGSGERLKCLEYAGDRIAAVLNDERDGADQPIVPAYRLPPVAGVPRELDDFLYTHRFTTLLAAAYDQLSYHIVEKAPVERCDACGASFIIRRTNQRYCPGGTCQKTAEKRRQRSGEKDDPGSVRHNDQDHDPEYGRLYAEHL